MVTHRMLLWPLGFFGSISVIMLCLYGWDELQTKRVRMSQEQRKQRLEETCSAEGKRGVAEVINNLENLLVDVNHGFIYCYIPKVACTNWKKVMIVLKHNEPYPDPNTVRGDVHGRLTPLNSFPRAEMMAMLKHYTKFLFVRDPFVRVISAYRDKFERLNEPFYQNYARGFLIRYGNQSNPPQTMGEALALGMHASFHNFIQYLLDPRTESNGPFNEHWKQMHRLCHPCNIQYDFIGHQEYLQEDAEQLLRLLMLHNDIKFPNSYVNVTSSTSVLDWFRSVPVEDRRKLYKLYERDFRMFGYRKPDELLHG